MFFGCYPIFHFIVDYYCLFPIKKTGEPLVPPFFVTLCFLKILLNLEKFYLLKSFIMLPSKWYLYVKGVIGIKHFVSNEEVKNLLLTDPEHVPTVVFPVFKSV